MVLSPPNPRPLSPRRPVGRTSGGKGEKTPLEAPSPLYGGKGLGVRGNTRRGCTCREIRYNELVAPQLAGKRQIMKRILFAAVLCITSLFIGASLAFPLRARAEGTPAPTVTIAPTDASAPARSPQDILDEANRAANYADRAVNTVNVMLAFVQVAALIIGAAIAFTTAAGFRTIRDYNAELEKSRGELTKMRI